MATPLEAGVRLTQELANVGQRTALVQKINVLRATHENARARYTITHDGFARLKHQVPRNVGRLFCGHHAGLGFLATQSLGQVRDRMNRATVLVSPQESRQERTSQAARIGVCDPQQTCTASGPV